MKKIKRSKVARQWDEVWRQNNDPDEIAKRRILKNRQERLKNKKVDLSL